MGVGKLGNNFFESYGPTNWCIACKQVIPEPEDKCVFLVSDMVREGPSAKPTHPCCWPCCERGLFLTRGQCQGCGVPRPLLFVENDSATTTWIDVGAPRKDNGSLQVDSITLCPDCQDKYGPAKNGGVWHFPWHDPPYPKKVLLTEDDIEILKKCWRLPDWKTRTKMPNFRRSIDDN